MAVQLTVTTNTQTVNLTVQKYTPSGVQSVTGDGVGGTAQDVVMTFPTPTQLGLGNVDNTSDTNKPVSTAQQTALDLKTDKGGYEGTAQDLKTLLDAIAGGSQGAIAIADTPTEIGYYYPTESGTYTNADGLVVDLTDGVTILIFDGTDWGMQVAPVDLAGFVPKDAVYVSLENTLINGNFTSTTNWGGSSNTRTVLDNEMTAAVTALSGTARIEQTIDDSIVGHKYFVKIDLLAKYANATKLQIGGADLTVYPVADEYTELKGIITATTTARFRLYHSTIAPYIIGDTFKVKYAIAVDLTAVYGAGNEPTLEDFDIIISQYTNKWFDGSDEFSKIELNKSINENTQQLLVENYAADFQAKKELVDVFYFINEKIPLNTTAGKYLNSNGTISDVGGFYTSDRKKVNNLKTLKITGNFNAACYVVYFSIDGFAIGSFTDVGTGILERTLTIPEHAYFYQFCSTIATVYATAITVNSDWQINKPSEIYISLTGNDTTGDGTSLLPFRTVNKGLNVLSGEGTLIVKNGDYFDETITNSLIKNSVIKGESRDGVRFIYGNRITSATLVDGYTKVYKKAAITVQTYDYELWQHDIADTSTAITVDERHAIQKDATNRLTSTRLMKVASIAAVEASSVPVYYYDGTDLYFQKADGSDLATNPIVIPVWNYIITDRSLQIENVTFLYRPFILNGCTGYFKNLKVAFNSYTNIYCGTTTEMLFEEVESCGSHEDGFGYQGFANCIEKDCWAHNNIDEGSSQHEQSKLKRYRGLYEKNIAGITDVGSSQSYLENVVSRYNGANGSFLFTYYPDDADNGNSVLVNCIGDGLYLTQIAGGGATGKRTKCYNCIGAVASSTIEVL